MYKKPKIGKVGEQRREMFYPQYLLSKNGPLGAIWVAAYCLKRIHRDQISQIDIPSSVDKILIDEWQSVTYRILAYLLLGVVRIYSKKVEFVLHDCREIINELHKFASKKKAISFRERVCLQDFSITLPETYELDAFDLELSDDVDKAHVSEKEGVILQESLKNDKFSKCSINKTTTATTKQQACSSAQNPPEAAMGMETCCTPLALVEKIVSSSCMEIEILKSSSQLRRSLETSIEELREIRFSREECFDLENFYQNDKEHFGIFGSSSIVPSANFEHSDFIGMMKTEKDGHFHAEVEVMAHKVDRNIDFEMELDNYEHIASKEKEANFTVQTNLDFKPPSNSQNPFAPKEEMNFTVDRSFDLEMTSANYQNAAAMEKMTFTVERTDLRKSSQSSDCPSVVPVKEKLTLTTQTTPDLKIPDVKDPSSIELLAVRTPANKERVRTASKRKCVYDDSMVLSNQTLKNSINDASGLIRKRRKVPHTRLAMWRLSFIYNLPQKLREPLIPWYVMDAKDFRRESNKIDQFETEEASDKEVMAVSPRNVNESTDCQLKIAPGTPILCPSSTRLFASPKAVDSDGEGPFLSFQNARSEDLCHTSENASMEDQSHSFKNARRDFAEDNEEEIGLDLMDKEMGQNGDSQELDGWSARTRIIARWLHQIIINRLKCNKAETVNLSQILDRKTRKESARVFHEILVLRSGEFLSVSQERPYEDIFLQETRKMEGKLAKCIAA